MVRMQGYYFRGCKYFLFITGAINNNDLFLVIDLAKITAIFVLSLSLQIVSVVVDVVASFFSGWALGHAA